MTRDLITEAMEQRVISAREREILERCVVDGLTLTRAGKGMAVDGKNLTRSRTAAIRDTAQRRLKHWINRKAPREQAVGY